LGYSFSANQTANFQLTTSTSCMGEGLFST